MKAILALIVTAMLIAGLTGCAATSMGHEPMKAKCPACGHEFTVPVGPYLHRDNSPRHKPEAHRS